MSSQSTKIDPAWFNMMGSRAWLVATTNSGNTAIFCQQYKIIIIKRESYQPINYFHDFFFVFQVFFLFNLLDDAAGKNERAVSCRKTFEYSKVKTSEYDREYIYTKIETICKKIFMTKWVLTCMICYISYSIYLI